MSSQEWPTVAVLIPTYERPEVLQQTIELLAKNLKYQGKVTVLIGDDSNSPTNLDFTRLETEWETNYFEANDVQYFFHAEQYGLGRNLNSLLAEAQRQGIDYVISQDDDHWLVGQLDLNKHVKKLMEDQSAGAIRLQGIGGHHYRANLDGLYWRIDWNGPELYICSNRPHLKSISRFHGEYGFYPEGFKLGLTEEKFCHLCRDKAHARQAAGQPTLDVLIPLDTLTESSWQHNEHHGAISWQARGF